MTGRGARPAWVSAALGLGAIALVVAAAAVVVTTRGPEPPRAGVDTPAGPTSGGCGPPTERRLLEVPGAPTPPPPAAVAIPGATEVALDGFVVTDVVAGGGQAWANIVESARPPTAPAGRVARIDTASATVTATIPVVDGCSVSALAVGEGGVWVGTCDELAPADATAGGTVVHLDPGSGELVRSAPLPTRCVADMVAGDGAVAASSLALGDQAARVWRIDPATGAVSEIRSVDDAGLGGIATTDDGLWTQELGGDGDEAVRSDSASGDEEVSLPEDDAALVGGHADAVWFQRPGVIVQRASATGEVRTETALADVRTVAVGASGAWFEQLAPGTTTITVGRIDPESGAVTFTLQFQGAGPDRTGRPLPVTLAADETGAWIVHQGRLFRVALPGLAAPEAPEPAPEAVPAPEPEAAPEPQP